MIVRIVLIFIDIYSDSKQRQPAIADFIKYVNDEDKSLKVSEFNSKEFILAFFGRILPLPFEISLDPFS